MHDLHLFHQAEAAHLGGGGEGPGRGDEPPLDGVGHPLVLQLPDMSGQPGPHPLVAVPEGVGVVVVPTLPVRLGQANVGLVHLANCGDRIYTYIQIFVFSVFVLVFVCVFFHGCLRIHKFATKHT